MVRTDMDALPLEEKTGLSFASKVMAKDDNGKEVHVMHACGHDMHMTVWLGSVEPDRYREHQESGLPLPGLHNHEFYPDFENTYTTGVGAMSRALLDLFYR